MHCAYNTMMRVYAMLAILLLFAFIAVVYVLNRSNIAPAAPGIMRSPQHMTLSITSPVFENNGRIPAKFTCDAGSPPAGGNPPLEFSGVPAGAKSLALIMDDPDVPKAVRPDGVFDHWTLFNIPPTTKGIQENGSAGIAGTNGAGANAYTGPCPPPQYEPSEHRYFFRLYALDAKLSLPAGASKSQVQKAMGGHIIEQAELIGRYKRI